MEKRKISNVDFLNYLGNGNIPENLVVTDFIDLAELKINPETNSSKTISLKNTVFEGVVVYSDLQGSNYIKTFNFNDSIFKKKFVFEYGDIQEIHLENADFRSGLVICSEHNSSYKFGLIIKSINRGKSTMTFLRNTNKTKLNSSS